MLWRMDLNMVIGSFFRYNNYSNTFFNNLNKWFFHNLVPNWKISLKKCILQCMSLLILFLILFCGWFIYVVKFFGTTNRSCKVFKYAVLLRCWFISVYLFLFVCVFSMLCYVKLVNGLFNFNWNKVNNGIWHHYYNLIVWFH